MLEKSKLAQHSYEEDHRICWNEAKVLQIEPNTIYRKYKESPHVSARTSDQPTQCGYLSRLDTCHNRNQETSVPSNAVGVDNFLFLVLALEGVLLLSRCDVFLDIPLVSFCFLCWHHKEYCFSPGVTSF
jgi:hypothetical protein